MVEVGGRRSKLLSLVKSLNPLKTRRPSLGSSKEVLVETAGHTCERSQSPYPSPLSPTTKAEVLPEAICPVCLNLGQEIWDHEYRVKHSLGWVPKHMVEASDVVRAAERGCLGCEIVSWVLKPYTTHSEAHENVVRIRFSEGRSFFSNGSYVHELKFDGRTAPIGKIVTDVVVKSTPCGSRKDHLIPSKNPSCPWKFLEPDLVMTDHMGSIAAIARVKTWFSQCLFKHSRCQQVSIPQLPTRVVKINGPTEVMLYTPEYEFAAYACLSHCWGGRSIPVTTIKNIKQYSISIPYDNLPAAFQHSIQFAYGLGIHYLWIDSLCIIQDSIDDWRHEGSRMSQTYENASITLSTTGFADSHHGCFAAPEERFISRTKTFTNSDHETYEIHCRELLPQLKAPLYKRGWVFQERTLSRRIIHFMEKEIWWECRESFHCECGSPKHYQSIFGTDMNLADEISQLSSPGSTERRWEEVVRTYSSKLLTYPSDIFPAIQALAKLVPSYMGRYLAGHWENTLILSLCWFVRESARVEYMGWRAPSWSWAAAQGAVAWHYLEYNHRTTTYVTVLSAMTIPKGDDPTGQLSYGTIVLRGKYLAAQMQSSTSLGTQKVFYTVALQRSQQHRSSKRSQNFAAWDKPRECEDGKQVVLLKIYQTELSYPIIFEHWLILKAIEGTRDEYVRIGIMSMYTSPGSLDSGGEEFNAAYEEEAVEMDLKII